MKIRSITKKEKQLTVDIEVSRTHTYQLSNGVVSHNTSSLTVGSSSGIHAWFNDYYVRRIRVGKNESLYRYMRDNLPTLVEDCVFKPHLEAVMSFPQKAPEGAILRTETAKSLLNRVKKFNREWVMNGHNEGVNYHNVSCTISLRNSDWDGCREWMWNNREFYTGISVLPYDGGSYQQTPFEDITEQQYNEMVGHLHAIDITKVIETDDQTELNDQVACAGGICEL